MSTMMMLMLLERLLTEDDRVAGFAQGRVDSKVRKFERAIPENLENYSLNTI